MTDRETVINNLGEFVDYARIRAEGRGDSDAPFHLVVYSRAVSILEDALELLKGGWISVKDRLPDAAGYECLVCAVNENYNQTHVFTAHTGYGEPGWWTSNVHYMSRAKSPSDNSLHSALKVTHWMPLPEPPKEGNDD